MIKVQSALTVYELDGQEIGPGLKPDKRPEVVVMSHWNRSSLVVLDIDGGRYAVCASDLIAAVRNATNTGGL